MFTRGAERRPEDLARSMTGITRESERMSLLVEDLLLLARLDEGRPLEQEPVDLAEVVGGTARVAGEPFDLAELFGEAVAAPRVVEAERPLELSVDPATVIGDRDRLRQVLDNLFANVRAHTPPGT